MIVTWMVGSLLFAALAALAALAAERALHSMGRERRWPWIAAVAIGTVWPLAAGVALLAQVRPVQLAPVVIGAQPPSAIHAVAAQLPLIDATMIDTAGKVLAVLWLMASLVLVTRLLVGVRQLRVAEATGMERSMDGTSVLVTDSLGPAVYGALKPRIIVPRWLFDLEPPLRALVLSHEQQHRARGDAAVIVGAALATALVPWNAAVWWMARRIRLAVELDCDSLVVASAGDAERYSKLLLLIAQRQTHTGLVPMLAESSAHLGRRIAAMNGPRPSRSYARAVAFGAVAVGVAAFACSNRVMSDVTAPTPISATKLAALPQGEKVFFEFQVARPVTKVQGSARPAYPEILKMAGVEGEVLAQFVVDENGVAMPGTLKVLKSTHALFVQAIQNGLPDMRFTAAEVNGKKVKQLVQMPFVFAMAQPAPALEVRGRDTVALNVKPSRPPRPAEQPATMKTTGPGNDVLRLPYVLIVGKRPPQ